MVFGRHVLEALVPEVEQEVAGGAGVAHDHLTGLGNIVTPGVRRGHLSNETHRHTLIIGRLLPYLLSPEAVFIVLTCCVLLFRHHEPFNFSIAMTY